MILFALHALACSSAPDPTATEILRLAPHLPLEAARALAGGDEVFQAYCERNLDSYRCDQLRFAFISPVRDLPPDQAVAEFSKRRRYIDIINRALEAVYAHDLEVDRYEVYWSWSPRKQSAVWQYWATNQRILSWPDSTPGKTDSLAARAVAAEELRPFVSPAHVLRQVVARMRGTDLEMQRTVLTRAVEFAEQDGFYEPAVHLLGVLAAVHRALGYEDSAESCLARAFEMAHKRHIAKEVGRIAVFYANVSAHRGRMGRASDLFEYAREAAAQGKAGPSRVRFALDGAEFHAALGCWDLVDRNLDEAERWAMASSPVLSGWQLDRIRARVGALRARALAHRGRPAEGLAILRELDTLYASEELERGEWRELYAGHLAASVELQVLMGRLREAEAVGTKGLDFVRAQAITGTSRLRLALDLARARFELGDFKGSAAALQAFEESEGRHSPARLHLWVRRDALRIELARATGNSSSVIDAYDSALRDFGSLVGQLEPAAQSYMYLETARCLRDLGHELLVDAPPEVSYVFDLAWRRLPRALGHPGAPVFEELGSIVSAHLSGHPVRLPQPEVGLMRRLERGGAIHHLFYELNGRILRWTNDNGRVEQRALSTRPSEVWTRSREILAQGHQARLDELHEELESLRTMLFPEYLPRETDHPRNIFVSADGILARLPISWLWRQPSGELLHDVRSVAFLRSAPPAPQHRSPTPRILVVTDGGLSPEIARRFGAAEELGGAQQSTAFVSRYSESVETLMARDEDKSHILAVWPGSSVVYFATHQFRDPIRPYYAYIPLAVGESIEHDPARALRRSRLDILDIRNSKPASASVVVLAACETGASSVDGRNIGPSLAEAFIDQGADWVLQTMWSMEDQVLATLLENFGKDGPTPGDPEVPMGVEWVCAPRQFEAR